MTMYINPKSLRDPLRREYLKASRKFGANIGIRILGSSEGYLRAVIEIEASAELIRALKSLGVDISKKPIPARFSARVLAEIAEKNLEEIPIGIGERGNIVRVDVSKPIATNCDEAALLLLEDHTLWVDFVGNQIPLEAGFVEIDGFPIPRSETKLYNLASVIARISKRNEDQVIGAIKAHIARIISDEEISISPIPEVDELFRWRVLVDEGAMPKKAYIDLTGLPMTLQRLALKIAVAMWTHMLIVALPSPWNWVAKLLKRKHVVLLTGNPQRLDVPTIITENTIIKRVPLGDKIVNIESRYEPFWKLATFLLKTY